MLESNVYTDSILLNELSVYGCAKDKQIENAIKGYIKQIIPKDRKLDKNCKTS